MILNIDHIVLTINDMEKTISFYRDVLGMTVKEFQPVGGGETVIILYKKLLSLIRIVST